MYDSEIFVGYPINFNDICLVYPPLIKDIIGIGYPKFQSYISILTKTQEEIDDLFVKEKEVDFSPFTFLLAAATTIPTIAKQIKSALLFFTHEKAIIVPELSSIVIGDVKERRIINQENFFDFQNIVRAACGLKIEEKEAEETNPKIRRFKALQRERDAVKAKAQSGMKIEKLSTLLTSACCLNVGFTPMNIKDATFGAVNMMIERYAEKERFENSFAVSLAGADVKNNEYWIKDL